MTSPVYRGLTFQFKVYIQMSAMTVGSCIEADRRFRGTQELQRRARLRRQKAMQRDAEVWREYEKRFGQEGGDDGG